MHIHLALRLSSNGVEDNLHGRNKLHGQGGGTMRRSAERTFAGRRRATVKRFNRSPRRRRQRASRSRTRRKARRHDLPQHFLSSERLLGANN
jgi:hypothetical protein